MLRGTTLFHPHLAMRTSRTASPAVQRCNGRTRRSLHAFASVRFSGRPSVSLRTPLHQPGALFAGKRNLLFSLHRRICADSITIHFHCQAHFLNVLPANPPFVRVFRRKRPKIWRFRTIYYPNFFRNTLWFNRKYNAKIL